MLVFLVFLWVCRVWCLGFTVLMGLIRLIGLPVFLFLFV